MPTPRKRNLMQDGVETAGPRRWKAGVRALVLTLAVALCLAPSLAQAASGTYDFQGAYRAAFTADGEWLESDSEEISAAEPDQNAVLALNGGAAVIEGGAVSKSGDGADDGASDDYGVNAAAVCAGEGARVLLSDAQTATQARGASALFATNSAYAFANAGSMTTAESGSRGLYATYGGQVIGNGLTLATTGASSEPIGIGAGAGSLSLANSTLSSAGADSPLVRSAGIVEADNVSGKTSSSSLAVVEGPNSVVLANSSLDSTAAEAAFGKAPNSAVVMYGLEADATATQASGASDASASSDASGASTSSGSQTSSAATALFQSDNSSLSADIDSGAFFYLTNTRAKVVLSNTSLNFDSASAKLLQASGNEISGWGSAGKNGAQATFTGKSQKLAGTVDVDSASSVDFYLLEGSSWTGTSTITAATGASGAAAVTDNLTVNVDATSSWTVSENATVSNLNLASGGKLVDELGAGVKILDGNGLTLVDGASDLSVTVTGDFSTSLKTGSVNDAEASRIDRAGFDEWYGTSTAFGTNAPGTDEAAAEQLIAFIRSWFDNL